MKGCAESLIHPFPPTWDEKSEILILGSFPSVKSREMAYYYGHPQNRFWRVVAHLYSDSVPQTIEERRSAAAFGVEYAVLFSCATILLSGTSSLPVPSSAHRTAVSVTRYQTTSGPFWREPKSAESLPTVRPLIACIRSIFFPMLTEKQSVSPPQVRPMLPGLWSG